MCFVVGVIKVKSLLVVVSRSCSVCFVYRVTEVRSMLVAVSRSCSGCFIYRVTQVNSRLGAVSKSAFEVCGNVSSCVAVLSFCSLDEF